MINCLAIWLSKQTYVLAVGGTIGNNNLGSLATTTVVVLSNPGPSGGGGGGGVSVALSPGEITIPAGSSGTANLNGEAAVVVPAGAIDR